MEMFESDILASWDPVTDKAMSSLDYIMEFSNGTGVHHFLVKRQGHNADELDWWEVDPEENISSSDMIVDDNGDYYCQTGNPAGDTDTLIKISGHSLKKLWSMQASTPLGAGSEASSLLSFDLTQEHIYLGSTAEAATAYDYNLWKIKTVDGSVVWKRKVGSADGTFTVTSLAVDPSTGNIAAGLLVWLTSGWDNVYVYDSDGNELWSAAAENRCSALAYDSNSILYAGFSSVLGLIWYHPEYPIHVYNSSGNEIDKFTLQGSTGVAELVHGISIRQRDNAKIIMAADCYRYNANNVKVWEVALASGPKRCYFHEDAFYYCFGDTEKRLMSNGALVFSHAAFSLGRALSLSPNVAGLVNHSELTDELPDRGRDCGCFLDYTIPWFISEAFNGSGYDNHEYAVDDIAAIYNDLGFTHPWGFKGVYKCHTPNWVYDTTGEVPRDYWKRLSFACPRPFSFWWEDYVGYLSGRKVYHPSTDKFYECNTDHGHAVNYEPPHAYWTEVAAPDPIWSDYNTAATNGEFDIVTADDTFAPADVNINDDKLTTIDIATGSRIRFSSDMVLPSPLQAGKTYYAINIDVTHTQVALDLARATLAATNLASAAEASNPAEAAAFTALAADATIDLTDTGTTGAAHLLEVIEGSQSTPFYYTLVARGFTGDLEYLNGGYHLQHVTDDFDGRWRFQRYNPGGVSIEINYELCNDSEETKIEILASSQQEYLYENADNYGCSYELHTKADDGNPGESRSAGSGIVSLYPGDIKLWQQGRIYSLDELIVYDVDGRFYRSAIANNTFAPPASWALLS